MENHTIIVIAFNIFFLVTNRTSRFLKIMIVRIEKIWPTWLFNLTKLTFVETTPINWRIQNIFPGAHETFA